MLQTGAERAGSLGEGGLPCALVPAWLSPAAIIAGRIVVVTVAGMCACESSLVLHQSVFD